MLYYFPFTGSAFHFSTVYRLTFPFLNETGTELQSFELFEGLEKGYECINCLLVK